jgi:hypothetical protein
MPSILPAGLWPSGVFLRRSEHWRRKAGFAAWLARRLKVLPKPPWRALRRLRPRGRPGDRAPRAGTLRAQLGRQRLDFAFDLRARSVGCETEIVRVLEIQPERCAGAEVACKPQCRFRRDGALEQRAATN